MSGSQDEHHELALRDALQRAVPEFADWCAVEYRALDGELRTVHSGDNDARSSAPIRDADVLAALRAGTGPPLPGPGMARITSVRLSSPELTPVGEMDEASSIAVALDRDGGSRGRRLVRLQTPPLRRVRCGECACVRGCVRAGARLIYASIGTCPGCAATRSSQAATLG